MEEITISYAPELQRLLDMRRLATEAKDAIAQFQHAKCLLKSKQKDMRKKAFSTFKTLANQSCTMLQNDARYMLGVCYENGYGIQKSYPRAIRWYKMVDHSIGSDLRPSIDFSDAEFNKKFEALLDELDNQEIAPELVECMIDAAEGGDVEAQNFLIDLYEYGDKYRKPDYTKAAYWTKRAAENGDVDAMDQLGRMYYYGQGGVERNFRKGLDLMEQAARQGSASSAYHLGRHDEKITAYKKAAEWFRLYAELEIKRRNKRLGWNPAEQNKPDTDQK